MTASSDTGTGIKPEGAATRIDFAFGAPNRLRTACQVVHRHYLAGRSLLVYGCNAETLQAFDRLLWSFEPTAFIPHAFAPEAETGQACVVLCSSPPLAEAERLFSDLPWLINLDLACPPGFERFERILEIVSSQPEDRNAARERWRQYVAAGITPRAHDLAASGRSRD
ncbi:DNA polymerase III subunit chi [Paracandidimonas soli]|uniref:DNA polymerase III chi subunit n=1 Tax=Paracandidimonas soli TaxID=1917182 RepID=A0A4R3UNH1_9BURK|nr:DNA polymerase III subunit chi [Paracandidimonas soli]TCU92231.1 DNA polymerase III chi subunit [Paracandidimonas soli]